MHSFFVLDVISDDLLRLYISLAYEVDASEVGSIYSDKKIRYDAIKIDKENITYKNKYIQFELEISVFCTKSVKFSSLDCAWKFHVQSNKTVCINAKSIRIEEYILIKDKCFYIAFDESIEGLKFDMSRLVPLNAKKILQFWSHKEQLASDGDYVLKEHEWWKPNL